MYYSTNHTGIEISLTCILRELTTFNQQLQTYCIHMPKSKQQAVIGDIKNNQQ